MHSYSQEGETEKKGSGQEEQHLSISIQSKLWVGCIYQEVGEHVFVKNC